MDGTEGFRPLCYQLHTVGRCMHSNVGTGQQKKNSFRIEMMRPMTVTLDYQGLREGFEDDVEYPECVS